MGRSNFDQGLGWVGGDIQPDKFLKPVARVGQRGAHLASGECKELGNTEPDANDKAGYYVQHEVAPLLGQGQGHHHEHPV